MKFKTAQQVLKYYWGFDSFRFPQDAIIEQVLAGQDVLALLPTGGGKSICFQVPGLMMEGVALVISPLIALMKDQVENLNRRGIPATFINSTLPKNEQRYRLEGVKRGIYKFLYLSPERLQSQDGLGYLEQLNISLLAVDEAHCVSQWGYDFRPDYLKIANVRLLLKNVPCIALTASATPTVQRDICEKLQLQKPKIFKKSFSRANLQYVVLYDENRHTKLLEILNKVQGTGLVYVRTRKKTFELADFLVKNHISAEPYHGGLETEVKNQIQSRWLNGQTRVIVGTNAFGMGIDKPDVRWVVHWEMPPDLESYYQEAGRAGRDEKKSYVVLFYHPVDAPKQQQAILDKFPDYEVFKKNANQIYDYLKIPFYHQPTSSVPFSIFKPALEKKVMGGRALQSTLKILELAEWIRIQASEEHFSRVRIIVSPDALHSFILRYTSCEPFMEILLRAFGGELFTHEVAFNLKELALKYGVKEKEFLQKLYFLQEYEVIEFKPASDEPSIEFLRPREPIHPHNIQWEKILFLKEQALIRHQAMVQYAENRTTCRQQFLLRYFGEEKPSPCGKCDVCLGRHKIKKVSYSLEEEILRLVEEGETQYQRIVQKVKQGNPEETKAALRNLIDREVLELHQYEVKIKKTPKDKFLKR